VLHSIVSSQRDTLLRTFSDVHVRATPQEVFDDPAVDAVVIATPNEQHAPLAIAALAAGKHVLVDKPFALDVAEAEAVLAAARDAGRIATVFQNRRFDADFLTLQALLAEGTGRRGRVPCALRPLPAAGARPLARTGRPGSGLWYDLGPHLLDQMLVLFGWPEAIDADLAVQREGGSGIDYFHAVLHYPRHRAIVHAGSLVAAPTPHFSVHGSKASWIKHGLDVQEAQLRRGVAPGAPAGASIRGMASWCAAMPRTTCSAAPSTTCPATTGGCMRSSPRRCTATAKRRSARCRRCS
jgi:predicted dehydrogenase